MSALDDYADYELPKKLTESASLSGFDQVPVSDEWRNHVDGFRDEAERRYAEGRWIKGEDGKSNSEARWNFLCSLLEVGMPWEMFVDACDGLPFFDKPGNFITDFKSATTKHNHRNQKCSDAKCSNARNFNKEENDTLIAAIEARYPKVAETTELSPLTDGVELDDFLAEDEPEFDWLIPGLLEREERLILTGGEGNGKSTWMRQFGIQCASGIHPITRVSIAPVKVLMIDLENPRRIIRRKMQELRQIAGTSYIKGNLVVLPKPEGLNLSIKGDAQWLADCVEAHKPELLLIGPLYKMTDKDLSDDQASKIVSSVLDQIRTYYGCSLIIEAHLKHASPGLPRPIRPYGASLWLRWPEFGLYLGASGEFKHWRNPRDERPWPTTFVRGNLGKGDWPWMIGDSSQVVSSVIDGLRRLALAEQDLLDIVGRFPGLNTTDLTERLKEKTGITSSTDLSQIIQSAADLRKISRIKRGRALVHFLPDVIPE